MLDKNQLMSLISLTGISGIGWIALQPPNAEIKLIWVVVECPPFPSKRTLD